MLGFPIPNDAYLLVYVLDEVGNPEQGPKEYTSYEDFIQDCRDQHVVILKEPMWSSTIDNHGHASRIIGYALATDCENAPYKLEMSWWWESK